MNKNGVTLTAVIGIAAFVLPALFFFLEFPATDHEKALMLVAGIYGVCLGVAISGATRYLFMKANPRAPITRHERISKIEEEITQYEVSIIKLEGETASSLASAEDARKNGWLDYCADHTASANVSQKQLLAAQRKLSAAQTELARIQTLSDRAWAKERKRRGSNAQR